MKPSLHELISKAISDYDYELDWRDCMDKKHCDELAEQIIKIVRDYHLVESVENFGDKERRISK